MTAKTIPSRVTCTITRPAARLATISSSTCCVCDCPAGAHSKERNVIKSAAHRPQKRIEMVTLIVDPARLRTVCHAPNWPPLLCPSHQPACHPATPCPNTAPCESLHRSFSCWRYPPADFHRTRRRPLVYPLPWYQVPLRAQETPPPRASLPVMPPLP